MCYTRHVLSVCLVQNNKGRNCHLIRHSGAASLIVTALLHHVAESSITLTHLGNWLTSSLLLAAPFVPVYVQVVWVATTNIVSTTAACSTAWSTLFASSSCLKNANGLLLQQRSNGM
jgi:hypothetical protein